MTDPKEPLILEIKGNSLDDGPGIRTVVFFKGCPLSCAWCHNVESKKAGPEISFDANECVGCGTCREVCPENALSPDNPYYVDRGRCTLCFECADACPSGALSPVGKRMSVDEVLGPVLRDKPFYTTSGGGCTLSGGEPALFMEYTARLAEKLREHGVHVLLETSGFFDLDRFLDLLYPHLDMIYMDVKIMDPAAHKKFCGVDNTRILANMAALNEKARDGGVPILPRVPLVPGMTDNPENLSAIASYLADIGAERVGVMPYNPLWRDKTGKVGLPFEHGPEMERWMTPEHVRACRDHFTRLEIEG
ncbi:MAG: glycyl-radical enzyme activating protein [Desulfatibacillaceae bacterium]